jgi:hypothetical protein
VSDKGDSTPAVWDPAARDGAGGWVKGRPGHPRRDLPEPSGEPFRPAAGGADGADDSDRLAGAGGVDGLAGAGGADGSDRLAGADGAAGTDGLAGAGGDQSPTARLPRVPQQLPEQSGAVGEPWPGATEARTQPLSRVAAAPPPPGYPPTGYARPPYARPTPGQPYVPEPPPSHPAADPAAPQRRRISPALLVLAVVVAAVLVALVGVLALGGKAKTPTAQAAPPQASTPAAAPVGTAPASAPATGTATGAGAGTGTGAGTGGTADPSPTAAVGDGKSQATAVDQLLGGSSSANQQVTDAVAEVSQCDDPASVAAARTTLEQAAASRSALVAQLRALNVSQVQGGAQAVQVLVGAWSASAAADTDYALWARAMSGGGCTADNAPPNADYDNAGTESQSASTDKDSFIDLWTPIAMQYGLPTRTADAI